MKQKLIDANEFAIEEPKLWDWNSVDDISSTAVLKQCIWDVQCAPTVDAIPIEWLKQWEEKHKEDPCYCGFVSEEIIKDWEKENEDV